MTSHNRKLIGGWLLIGVYMIFIQVILGGITRLTGSGLSITQWDLIMGTIPPMNQSEWQHAFDLYKQTPQFRLMNSDITIAGFKSIFFWEYLHRLWARLFIPVFLIPLAYFIVKGMMTRPLILKAVFAFVLGAMQAVVGWIMVQSGLVDQPWVNPLNLSLHLILALILYCYLFWIALQVLSPAEETGSVRKLKGFSWLLLALIFLQIFYGGLMAGNKTALFYPTWPQIGSTMVPDGILQEQPWLLNFIKQPGMIQLIHRNLGYLIAILIFIFYFRSRNRPSSVLLKRAFTALPLFVILQVLLGILTLLNSLGKIPVSYGVLHQATALILLTVMVFIHFQVSAIAEKEVAQPGYKRSIPA